jgi:hypothetical protein
MIYGHNSAERWEEKQTPRFALDNVATTLKIAPVDTAHAVDTAVSTLRLIPRAIHLCIISVRGLSMYPCVMGDVEYAPTALTLPLADETPNN